MALGRAIVNSLRQSLATAWLTPLLIGAVATAAVTLVADIPFNFANVIVVPAILTLVDS